MIRSRLAWALAAAAALAYLINALLASVAAAPDHGFVNFVVPSGHEHQVTLVVLAAALTLTGPGRYGLDARRGWARRPFVGSFLALLLGIGVGVGFWILLNGVGMIGDGFKGIAGDRAEELFSFAENPFVGLAIGAKNAERGADATLVGQGQDKHLLRADAYVVRTFRNGLAVFVSQYGLEGLITFKGECQYDPDKYEVTIPASLSSLDHDVTLGIFDRCTVEIGVEKDKSTKRGRVKMALVL